MANNTRPRLTDMLRKSERTHWGNRAPLSDRLGVISSTLPTLLRETISLPYTPHGFEHAKDVESYAAELLELYPPNHAALADPYNLYVLVLSIWFHDSGLVPLSEKENPHDIRAHHHLRIGQFLDRHFGNLIDPTDREIIRDVAMNHCLDSPSTLAKRVNIERCPFPNVQESERFLVYPRLNAAILRIADICSITNTRTPWCLFHNFTMNAESRKHWEAHLHINSLSLQASDESTIRIAISLRYSSHDLLTFINEKLKYVEREIETCNPVFNAHGLPPLAQDVIVDAYEATPGTLKSFSVLPRGMYDLLSRGLYGSPDVFVRELIQNALDAIARQTASTGDCLPGRIDVTVRYEGGHAPENVRSLVVRDYGIGMDQGDIDSYLLQIAAKATDDVRVVEMISNAGLDPLIQEWGVGFLSVFGVTNCVTLRTHREGMRPIKMEFRKREIADDCDVGGIEAYLEEDNTHLDSVDRGTEITLHLSGGLPFDLLERLQYHVRFPTVRIVYREYGTEPGRVVELPVMGPKGDQGSAELVHRAFRGGWIAITDLDYRPGVLLTQAGLLIEEHVTDLLAEAEIDIHGQIDCRSRFLVMPASRGQAVRNSGPWKELKAAVLSTVPEAVGRSVESAARRVCINVGLPRHLKGVVRYFESLDDDKLRDSLLETIESRCFFHLQGKGEVSCGELASQSLADGDKTVYLVSRGTTAGGSTYARGHFSIEDVVIWIPADVAKKSRLRMLEATGKCLLPIIPFDGTLGSEGYESQWLIESLLARQGLRVDSELIRESARTVEYESAPKNHVLREIWNKSDWGDLGGEIRTLCLEHKPWEFVFAMNSETHAMLRVGELWSEMPEARPLISLLVTCYCESLRVNPAAVVEAVEKYIEEEFGDGSRATGFGA